MIIPTKDEPGVGELVNGIHEALGGMKHEVIIVDKSALPPIVEGALVIRQMSRGLGRAILEGSKHASGSIIATMNGDFSHDPRNLSAILNMIPGYDLVIGSRFVPGGWSNDTIFRKCVSHAFRLLVKSFLRLNVADPLSGFWALRRETLTALDLEPKGFKIVMEILYKGKGLGLRTVEVPIIFERRQLGKSKAGVGEALRTLLFMVQLRLGTRKHASRRKCLTK